MRKVEASIAPRVIQKWQVHYNDSIVEGRAEDGHVALNSDGDSLCLYFAKTSIDTADMKWELVEQLYNFCGMDKSKGEGRLGEPRYLLTQILDTESQEQIDKLLDRAAVPPLASDAELKEATERTKRAYAFSGSQNSKERSAVPPLWVRRRALIEGLIAKNEGSYIFYFKKGEAFHPSAPTPGNAKTTGIFPPRQAFIFKDTRAMEGVTALNVSQGRYRKGYMKPSQRQANMRIEMKGENIVRTF